MICENQLSILVVQDCRTRHEGRIGYRGMDQTPKFDKRYLPALNRVFSAVVLDDLVRLGRSDYLDEVVKNSRIGAIVDMSRSLRDFFDDLYSILSAHYPSEYIYKNALAEQVYLGKHFEESHMLTELRVASCKADVAIFNGTSTVYEIKSDLDSLERLETQIDAYTSFFDRINVITSQSQIKRVSALLSSEIGVMALAPDGSIEVYREPESNKWRVRPSVIFSSLRKSEYLQIIDDKHGTTPNVPNTRIHQVCLELFSELTSEDAHDAMLDVLQRRGNSRQLKDFVCMAPQSLKACAATCGINKGMVKRFLDLLEQGTRSVILQTT